MTVIITLPQAKNHLRVDTDDEDVDIQAKVDSATAAVLNYLKVDDLSVLASGSPPTIPTRVMNASVAACLLMVGYLYRQRDNDTDHEYETGYLPRPVTALLYPFRDPACA